MSSEKSKKVDISFTSDDEQDEGEEETTSASSDSQASTEEESVDGEADGEEEDSEDDTPTFTLTIQPSVVSADIVDVLPDVVSNSASATTNKTNVRTTEEVMSIDGGSETDDDSSSADDEADDAAVAAGDKSQAEVIIKNVKQTAEIAFDDSQVDAKINDDSICAICIVEKSTPADENGKHESELDAGSESRDLMSSPVAYETVDVSESSTKQLEMSVNEVSTDKDQEGESMTDDGRELEHTIDSVKQVVTDEITTSSTVVEQLKVSPEIKEFSQQSSDNKRPISDISENADNQQSDEGKQPHLANGVSQVTDVAFDINAAQIVEDILDVAPVDEDRNGRRLQQKTINDPNNVTENGEDQQLPYALSNVEKSAKKDDIESKTGLNEPATVMTSAKDVLKTIINSKDDEHPAAAAAAETPDNDVTTPAANDETSGFRQRRNSIDDFIRRILAEAREEQKRLLDSVAAPPEQSESANGHVQLEQEVGALSVAAESKGASNKGIAAHKLQTEQTSTTDEREQRTSLENGELGSRDRLQPTAVSKTLDVDIDEELADISRYLASRSTRTTNYITDGPESSVDGVNDIQSPKITKLGQLAVEDPNSRLDGIETSSAATFGVVDRREFSPQRRQETSEVVRQSVRPVRALTDQQTKIMDQLKSTVRQLDELAKEFLDIRQTAADRRLVYDSLEGAIREEMRTYESEQRAAEERIQQQKMPGGRRFVREEFIALCNSASAGPRKVSAVGGGERITRNSWGRADSVDNDIQFRRRSGSVSGGYITVRSIGGEGGSGSTDDGDSGLGNGRRLSISAGDTSLSRHSVDRETTTLQEALEASRQRRACSVISDRTYSSSIEAAELRQQRSVTSTGPTGGSRRPWTDSWTSSKLRSSTDNDATAEYSPSSRSFSSSYMTDSSNTSDGSSRWTGSSGSGLWSRYLQDVTPTLVEDRRSYGPTRAMTATGDVYYTYRLSTEPDSSTTSPPATLYSSTSSSSSSFRYPQSASISASSSSADTSYTNTSARRFSSGYGSSSSTSSPSYSSFTSYRYGSGNSGVSGGEEFQSRFLERIREKKALGAEISSADSKPFKSRFLRSSTSSSTAKTQSSTFGTSTAARTTSRATYNSSIRP